MSAEEQGTETMSTQSACPKCGSELQPHAPPELWICQRCGDYRGSERAIAWVRDQQNARRDEEAYFALTEWHRRQGMETGR